MLQKSLISENSQNIWLTIKDEALVLKTEAQSTVILFTVCVVGS